ncbi:TonB-dependent siderophore receptor [Pseudomonas sp. Choline-3u-10]|uniref:TonB-dependent receptor family protein n=1 Tax=Pseudomonadaceae TaxID=135621 RepID=UPI000C33300C|nr:MULTISPECIES: TonB-dependent receptor [Pseudomonadaceae]PKG96323.1 TonB-dependent siderophore receptor [Pseudomonas sp. Choline-3u-10]
MHRLLLAGSLSLVSGSLLAQTSEPLTLDPLWVSSPRAESDWFTLPMAVSAVDAQDHPGEQLLSLDSLLGPVPGALSQSRYNLAQGMRLSIRGFGSRSSFGVRGVRVLVDGVPLTMPDGQTEMDGLDTSLVERIEVIRGPSSTIYGNAAGGVLAIQTRQPGDTPRTQVEVTGGELGYRRMRAETSGSTGALGALLAVNATQLDGYRSHGTAETNHLTGKLRWRGEGGTLGFTLHAIDNRAEDPGGLTLDQVRADRSQARPQSLQFDSDETIQQQRLSLVWDGKAAGDDTYQLRSYYGQREFSNRLPLRSNGQTAYDRWFAGVGAQRTFHRELAGLPHQLTVGVDLESQRDNRSRNDNLPGGITGVLTQRQRETADSRGVFIEDQVNLGDAWLLTAGLRYDSVRLEAKDRYLSDGDASGERNLEDWNYSLGLSRQLDAHHVAYVRYATSFETPTINEMANPTGGGFNPSLGAAQSVNREIGIKGEHPGLRYEAVLYSMRIEDELVPEVDGRTFYANAGRSSRDGVELSGDWLMGRFWRLTGAWAYNRYRFEQFQGYDGNRIPGIPQQSLFAEVSYDRDDWYARVNVNAYGRQYADNANLDRVPGYAVTNARLGWRLQWGDQRWEPYIGIDNLFDRDYYDNLRINDNFSRYYEPAPGRTFYAGAKLTFE